MKQTTAGYFPHIRVNISRCDSLLLNYGPVLVLGQFSLTGFTIIIHICYWAFAENPRLVTWAVFSPVYGGVLLTLLCGSLAVRSFINKIPTTFSNVWTDGLVVNTPPRKKELSVRFGTFLRDFEHRLNSPKRLYLGIPLSFVGVIFFWNTGHMPYVINSWLSDADLGAKIIVTTVNLLALFLPSVVIGYAIGISMWKSLVTAVCVHDFCRDFDLVVQASHPDRAGGLKPLGNLIFSLATIVIVASLALSGLVILAGYFSYPNTVLFSKAFLALSILLSLFLFIWPLLCAHERMLVEKSRMNRMLIEVTHRISELEGSTRRNIRRMNYKRRQELFSEIDSLKELYRRMSIAPTWPFDRDILIKFATPQLFSLISLVGAAEPTIRAIRTIFPMLGGGIP